jgi:hypothetical protein
MLEKMLHHKLLKAGEQGQGVITERHDQATESSNTSFSYLFELQGHIRFPDGTQTEFRSEWLSSHKVGDIKVGSIVPVRYDAMDHSKAVLDVVALEERRDAEVEKTKQWLEDDKARTIEQADATAAAANAETERHQLS